eukprot:c9210_g1_i2 orf=391-1575(+)
MNHLEGVEVENHPADETKIKDNVLTDKYPVQSMSSIHNLPAPSSKLFGKNMGFWILLTVSSLLNLLGGSSASLLGRLYFVRGGSRRWLYTWNQTTGFPILIIPLIICYCRKSTRPATSYTYLLIYTVIGFLTAFSNLLYSWGLSYLPVSTNSLLGASQLAFNALFSLMLVNNRITFYKLNSIVLITMSAVLLGVHADSDRPTGTTKKQYVVGFITTIAGSALYGLILTLTEIIYKRRAVKNNSFIIVLESQTCISAAATIFAMTGMWINGDFSAVSKEASNFDLGRPLYCLTLIWSAIGWQCFFLGSAGMIFLTSSLMSCVFMTATIPLIPVLAVIFFHDSFSPLKAISMLLSLWGFVSYTYGGYLYSKMDTRGELRPFKESTIPHVPPSHNCL